MTKKHILFDARRRNQAHYAKSLDASRIIVQRKQISGSYQITGCILHPMTTPAPSFNSEPRLAPFHTNGFHTNILQIILKKIWGIKFHFLNICNNFAKFVENYFWRKLFWHLNIFYFRRMKAAGCRAWRPVQCPVVCTIHYLLVWTLKYKSLPTRHRWLNFCSQTDKK